ncbi:hypothetical protein ABZZ74_54310 [Streptomyces sp. NPDC006476]|uniref:hypothetical protein n=1 Tax=Streptomyces sp. NPDC006476 TaxID=3157175 RepID=UPI00339FD4B9
MGDEWAQEGVGVRGAGGCATRWRRWGEFLPECLPGELEDCGTSAGDHRGVWLAMLKARAQFMIEANHGAPEAERLGGRLYRRVLEDGRRHFGL